MRDGRHVQAVGDTRRELGERVEGVRGDVGALRREVAASCEELGADIEGVRGEVGVVLERVECIDGRTQDVEGMLKQLRDEVATAEQVRARERHALQCSRVGTPVSQATVYGEKRWYLQPPGKSYVSRVPLVKWLSDEYPTLTNVEKPLECVQQAGDVLFIPAFWAHASLNLKVCSRLSRSRSLAMLKQLCLQPGISVSGEFDPAAGLAMASQ